jgi:thioredoxin 1
MNQETSVTHATTLNFDEEVLLSRTPVVVDFYADWCGPCKMLAPLLERAAADYAGRVKVVKVNVDDENDLAARYRISGIPTLVFFKDGKAADPVVGLLPDWMLREKVDQICEASPPPVKS